MKRKWMVLGGAIGISGIVMATTGFTALAGTSGYDAYKTALKQTKSLQSVSVQGEVEISDNGNVLSQGNGLFKVNLSDETASGTAQIGGAGKETTVELYKQQDGLVWKTSASNVYYQKSEREVPDKQESEDKGQSDWFHQQTETIVDAFLGNLKNEVQMTDGQNGGSRISLSLSNAQIPAVLQAAAPLMVKQFTETDDRSGEKQNARAEEPENILRKGLLELGKLNITQNVQIKQIDIQADVTADHVIADQQASITFTGLDSSGTSHEIAVKSNLQLQHPNDTTPDAIDLSGKQVQQVKHGHHED